jgi:hypothetical protein
VRIYKNQCPLCLEEIVGYQRRPEVLFPKPAVCTYCGGSYLCLNETEHRILTRKEWQELGEKLEFKLPEHIQEEVDRARNKFWG